LRPKFIITLGLLIFLVLSAALLLKRQLGNTSVPPASPEVAPAAPPAVSNIVANAAQPSTHATVPAITNVVLSAKERADEIDRLQDWSMNDDAESLNHIVADLTSPDKEIREAAIEATKQFGSADAIPSLKAAADSTENIEDKTAYLEAADFLSLPSMEITPITEEQAARLRTAWATRHPAQSQKGASGQNPQATPGQNPPNDSSQ
jgi:HEAT repeat protein